MHQTSGKSLMGFSLALTTAVLWGILPIALKMLLDVLSANTITAARFFVAAVIVGFVLAYHKKLPSISAFKSTKALVLIIIAVFGLLSNYIMYLYGLDSLSAEAAQVVIQLAPFLMMIGGVWLFKERLLFWQKIGAALLLIGLLLFFNERLVMLITKAGQETLGVLLVIAAAVTWAAYALAQKQLLVSFNSQQIMYMIYCAGTIAFVPVSDITPLADLSLLHWGLLLFCCLNTVVAYGAFAEALQHWQASRVSAVLAITPLLTISFSQFFAYFTPLVAADSLNAWAWFGAVLVVIGSVVTALSPSLKR